MSAKPTGRGIKSYNSGVAAAKAGKTYRDNPYLYCRIGQGGKTLAEWWRVGFDSVLQQANLSCNFAETKR